MHCLPSLLSIELDEIGRNLTEFFCPKSDGRGIVSTIWKGKSSIKLIFVILLRRNCFIFYLYRIYFRQYFLHNV